VMVIVVKEVILKKIKTISSSEKTVEKVKLLDINPRKTKNKTVITFIEELAQVVEATFRLIKRER
jgi:glutamate formiminotransferase